MQIGCVFSKYSGRTPPTKTLPFSALGYGCDVIRINHMTCLVLSCLVGTLQNRLCRLSNDGQRLIARVERCSRYCINCSSWQSVSFWNGSGDKRSMELCCNRSHATQFEVMVCSHPSLSLLPPQTYYQNTRIPSLFVSIGPSLTLFMVSYGHILF